jgi:Starch-binding associating with outer membrane
MKKIIIAALLPTLLMICSCEKYVQGFDVSPNSPSDAPVAQLLPAVQLSIFANYTGENARRVAILMQQQAGKLFQYEELEKYDIREETILNDWQTVYEVGLMNSQIMIGKAGESNKKYRGIAKVLKAMSVGLATDFWGDVPLREASRGQEGEAQWSPAYDAQEQILTDIQTLLDEAIVDLKANGANDNIVSPGANDLIFGGDETKWIATAQILKARYHNRLSKRDAAGSATRTLAAVDAALAAGAATSKDCMAIAGENPNEQNQWFAFKVSRGGYMTMNKTFLTILNTLNDPRLPLYAAKDAAGKYSETSAIGTYYGSNNANLPLVTYFELKFIEAEAALRTGNKQRAADALNAAVKENIKKVTGAANAAYETANASETATSITLDKIMTQKYIAMFTQPEVWADWRRTDIPKLTKNAAGVVNGIPRRLPTAQTERQYNAKAKVESNILARVWWDKE